MPLAEAARARNPIKFGTTPFIGKDSKEPLIYQAIELSADKKRVISGPRVMMQRDRIDVSVPLSTLYFFVSDNQSSDEDEESDEDSDQKDDGTLKIIAFFFGLYLSK